MHEKLSFIDKGKGDTIVFVHGTPTSSAEYEDVIGLLSKEYRCIAVDHLGFGKSLKPKNADYSLNAHRERLIQLLNNLDVSSFHLVVHDFGAVIALPLVLVNNFKIKSLTILNSWCWPLTETQPEIRNQRWLVTFNILPFFYKYLNFSAKVLLKMGWGKKKPLTKERHQFYINAFPTKDSRIGTVSFLKLLFDERLADWQFYRKFHHFSNIPVQIIWGKQDKLLTIKNLERFEKEMPYAKVKILDEVGHFIAEEAPEILASHLRDHIKNI